MKKRDISLRIRDYSIVLLGVGLGLLFWIFEPALDVFVFHGDNFRDAIFSPDPHEIWLRFLIFSIFTVFGVFAQISVKRQKQAEGILKESEERRLILFENANDPIFIGYTDGSIIDVNKRAVSLYGYTREEFIRMKISDITVSEQLDEQEESRKKGIEKGELRGNWRKHITKNGDILHVDFNASITNIHGKDIFISIIRDYTTQKKAEEALLESEALLRRSQEFSRMTAWDWHIMNDAIRWSGDVTSLFGRSSQEMACAEDLFNAIHSEDLPKCKEMIEESICSGADCNVEYRVIWPDGAVRWLRIQGSTLCNPEGRVTNLIGLIMEITESKQVEGALRKSEERYRTLFETTGTATFVVEEDTTFSMMNKEFIDRFGYSREELVGRSWTEFVSKDDLERLKGYHRLRRIDPDAVPKNYEMRFIDKQGDVRNILASIMMIPGTKQSMGSLADITDLKRAQASLKEINEQLESRVEERTMELKEAQEKLIASERLAVLGKFSGSISHEIRNPLGVIDSSAYYLKAKLHDADKKVLEHLDRIRGQVKHSTDIIESLLNLTRRKEPQKDRINIAEVINDAVSTLTIPGTIKFVNDGPGKAPLLLGGDKEQLHMTFRNIINNAIDAMEGEGTFTIQMRTVGEGRSAEVIFEDTGPGIAPENLPKIFQPLFSTKARGIGFGLAIAQQIVEKHGGTIDVKSEKGRGASFIVRLPLTSESA